MLQIECWCYSVFAAPHTARFATSMDSIQSVCSSKRDWKVSWPSRWWHRWLLAASWSVLETWIRRKSDEIHYVLFFGIEKCIEHDLQFGDRILACNDLRETFKNPFFVDSSARWNGRRHLKRRYDLLIENNEEFTKVKVKVKVMWWDGTVRMFKAKEWEKKLVLRRMGFSRNEWLSKTFFRR